MKIERMKNLQVEVKDQDSTSALAFFKRMISKRKGEVNAGSGLNRSLTLNLSF